MKFLAFAVVSIALVVSCGPTEQVASPEASAEVPATIPNGTRESPFMGHGVIQEITGNQLVIQHETIPGFMAGMTMAFPVTEEAMSDDLEVGDEIMFDIELLAEGYQVFSVEKVEAEGEE